MTKFLFPLFFLSACLLASPLRVGMELSYPPFEMVCSDGNPCGITVDMVHELGKFIEKEVQIENISFLGLIPSLQTGRIDLIASSLTITKQREKAIDFSDPYAAIGLSLLLNINSPINTITQANEKGATIVVKSGTSGELYALQHLKNATVRVLDKEATCVLEVVQGKADAFIYDQLSVYTNWRKNQSTTKTNLDPFQKDYWAFGVKKNNKELLEKVNLFIKKFKEEKGFENLGNKYLSEQKAAFEKMGVPFVF